MLISASQRFDEERADDADHNACTEGTGTAEESQD